MREQSKPLTYTARDWNELLQWLKLLTWKHQREIIQDKRNLKIQEIKDSSLFVLKIHF